MNKAVPNLRRFLDRFHVDLDHGTSWLDEHRMLVFQSEWYLDLREQLIGELGQNKARAIVFELGRAAGVRDALTAIKLSPDASFEELISTGGEFHAFQGAGRSRALSRQWDPAGPTLRAEFIWANSIEAEASAQSRHRIVGGACWMYTGHASGFISTIVGSEVLVKEIACVAHGAPECRCVAQYAYQWADGADASSLPVTPAVAHALVGGDQQAALGVIAEDSGLIGHSAAFDFVLRSARRVGRTNATVLLLGESGVGKSTIARFVHQCSDRADKQFVEINCAAIPENLLEAELFGVERGAFTGADVARRGRFEEADGGTLFLDEVGLLTPAAQGKLLRVLQSYKFERLGSSKTKEVDVRVIAATNDQLADAVANGSFRADLYYRLNVFPVMVPPLRSRRGDLPLLVDMLLKRLGRRYGLPTISIEPSAYRAMLHYDWPGNIRELENVLERAIILKEPGEPIGPQHIYIGDAAADKAGLHWLNADGKLSSEGDGADDWVEMALNGSNQSLQQIEHKIFVRALANAGGSIATVGAMLDLTRAQIDYRLRKWNLDARAYRRGGPAQIAE